MKLMDCVDAQPSHSRESWADGFGISRVYPNYLHCASEPFLMCKLGKPKTARNVRSVIEGTIREHSRKPDEAFEAAERLCGDVNRIELFSRQEREGWDVMGDQIEKFSA